MKMFLNFVLLQSFILSMLGIRAEQNLNIHNFQHVGSGTQETNNGAGGKRDTQLAEYTLHTWQVANIFISGCC